MVIRHEGFGESGMGLLTCGHIISVCSGKKSEIFNKIGTISIKQGNLDAKQSHLFYEGCNRTDPVDGFLMKVVGRRKVKGWGGFEGLKGEVRGGEGCGQACPMDNGDDQQVWRTP